MILRLGALAASSILTISLGVPASAASLRLSPILIEMQPSQRATAVTVTNTDSQPVTLQIRLYRWSQRDGEDKLDPTSDMIVSPPVATIPAGASYTIRLARRVMTPFAGEVSYRLMLDEIPKVADPNKPIQGVAMVLRTSLPVFVTDPAAKAQIGWQFWQDAGGIHVEATNLGTRRARIAGLQVEMPTGRTITFGSGLNGYVLAQATRRFDVTGAAAEGLPSLGGTQVNLMAREGDRQLKETVLVEQR